MMTTTLRQQSRGLYEVLIIAKTKTRSQLLYTVIRMDSIVDSTVYSAYYYYRVLVLVLSLYNT